MYYFGFVIPYNLILDPTLSIPVCAVLAGSTISSVYRAVVVAIIHNFLQGILKAAQ